MFLLNLAPKRAYRLAGNTAAQATTPFGVRGEGKWGEGETGGGRSYPRGWDPAVTSTSGSNIPP